MTVAVKCLRSKMLDGGEENQKSRQSLLADVINEVTSMCGLEHKHLIKLHGIVLNSANSLTSMLMMVTEYAPFGSLESYLRSTDGPTALPVKQLFSYTYQIANGMSYLESRGLIHRDLATRNILLLTLEHVKICDFGMSRSVAHFDSNASSTDYAGQKIPCAWYPPESIRARVFSAKSDVWSFGVTVWEVFTGGEQPWPRMTAEAILDKIERESERLPQPDFCSQSFYKIMLKCWSEVAAQRPSFKELEEMIQGIVVLSIIYFFLYKI
jgi:serine/threonine protein kinase